jgi:hypothetical protein
MAHDQSQKLALVNMVNKLYGPQLADKTFTHFRKTLAARYLIMKKLHTLLTVY